MPEKHGFSTPSGKYTKKDILAALGKHARWIEDAKGRVNAASRQVDIAKKELKERTKYLDVSRGKLTELESSMDRVELFLAKLLIAEKFPSLSKDDQDRLSDVVEMFEIDPVTELAVKPSRRRKAHAVPS